MSLICNWCRAANVEKRGSLVAAGALKQKIKCNVCNRWSRIDLTTATEPLHTRTEEEIAAFTKAERYIITCAQNNTPLDRKFWKALNVAANYYKAQILVVPVLYFPPGKADRKDIWWPSELNDYLVDNEITLCPGLRLMSHVKITATAVNPLSGFESLTQGDSAIFGHAQIQLKTVATPQNLLPKILQTTGSISEKNYSFAKSGIKGDFHHSLGAVIVEVDDGFFHIRGVNGDRKSEFYDLDKHFTPRGVKTGVPVEALVEGDTHEVFVSPDVKAATFTDSDSMVKVLKPKYVVRHDLVDSYSISHWHRKTPSIQIKKYQQGLNCLEHELVSAAEYLEETTPKGSMNVIVSSNHHDHIKRWLEEADWKAEPWNARIYHEMWIAWLDAIEKDEHFDPFVYWMKKNCEVEALWLKPDYPFIVKEIYLAFHGDRGANGSRGSLTGMAKIGVKTIIGHTHSPGIEKGAFQIGTSSQLKLEYTKGASSWMNTHCLIFKNSKRQLVHIIRGNWRKSNV